MRAVIREAYIETRNGYSSDVVIANPELNAIFIRACHKRGVKDEPVAINLALLRARKTNRLRGLERAKRPSLQNQDEYRFACEIAVRFLERRDQVSLDRILCDPGLAADFDKIAAQICPGYTSFHYRWAALNLRKARKLEPEIGGRLIVPEYCVSQKTRELVVAEIPERSGTYMFFTPTCALYVGEASNLYIRLKRHFDHSDNRGLAHWIWAHGTDELYVEYYVLPQDVSARQRKALEAELIQSRRPIFNVALYSRQGVH
jgi:site-specific DNA-methyltransferase (adenine-specific)